MKIIFTLFFVGLFFQSISQQNLWNTNVLNNGQYGNQFGTSASLPIAIYTGNIQKAFFTVGNSITVPWDFNGVSSGSGDGLKIVPQVPNSGALDLFTAQQGTTHIKFGGSGAISGQNSRMEYFAAGLGFYMNAVNGGTFKFARGPIVTGFVGTNIYWRIGEQTDAANINGARRLEVVDNTAQFRLTRGSSGGYTDFETRANGNLMILPIGERVGINLYANPTANIDVNGDARIRNVQAAVPNSILIGVNASGASDVNVRRLDFTGNAGQVLLGNGTWGSMGIGIGNFCSQPQNSLTENFEIPLNNFNYYFSGQGNITRTVGIGLTCNEPTFAKLHVRQTAQNFLITNNLGISAAGYFHNIANSSIVAYGVIGSSNGNNSINIGVYGEATGPGTNYAGYFEGDVYVNGGNNSGSGYVVASDGQFKTDINMIDNAISIIEQLQPKSYYMDTLNAYGINFSSNKQYGFIAQEIELVLPELISLSKKPALYDSIGTIISNEVTYKSLNYDAIIPILTRGIQEQATIIDSMSTANDSLQSQITDLNNRLMQLENCLSGILPFLCQMSNSAIQPTQEEVQNQLRTAINVNLSDRNAIVLNQNVPNPFAESTVIAYSIPASVQKAQIHFYDGQGKLINSVDVIERGNGQLNVFANDLSTGVYTYSLVADGQVVATKRMMKQ